jgi:hypothetical protein
MPKLANKKELLEYMDKEHAQHFKIAKMLLAAHGGALGTSLTILKEQIARPQFRGVSVFVILFSSGLIASILFYASVFLIRATVRTALMSDEDPNDSPSADFLKKLSLGSGAVAVLTFLAAIGLVIWRAA